MCRKVLAGSALMAAIALILITGLLFAPVAHSQTPETPAADVVAEAKPAPIPVEDLLSSGAEVTDMINGMRSRLDADSSLLAIRDLIPPARESIKALSSKTEKALAASPGIVQLQNLRGEWQGLDDEYKGWQKSIRTRNGQIGGEVDDLHGLIETWQLTAAETARERLPGDIIAGVKRTISDMKATENDLYGRRNDLLLLEQEVADLMADCEKRINETSSMVERIRAKLLDADAAPLWSKEALSEGDSHVGRMVRNALVDHYHTVAGYVAAEWPRVMGQLAFYLVALICITLLGRYARAYAGQDDAMERASILLYRPAAAAVVVTMLTNWWFHPQRPEALVFLFHLLLLIPLLAIVPQLLPRRFKPAVWALAIVYVADAAFELLPQDSFIERILRLGIRLALLFVAFWLLRKVYGRTKQAGERPAHKLVGAGLFIVMCVTAVSIVADVTGSVALADLLLDGIIESIYLGLLAWLGISVLRAMAEVILKTGPVRRTMLVRRHGERLRRGILRTLKVAGVVIWLIVTLNGFKVLEPAYAGAKQVIDSTIRVGSLEVATGDIILFFLVIWSSFAISRIVETVLEEGIYPRVSLPRGVPMAISKLTHLGILLIGFFFAIGVAGIDLNQFTLLAGALGVGIGFGLQNIVSNLVSGIFVLLERPVQIGDKVRIGTNEGEVQSIGLRATVIRNWEGAEVMVPNSRLVLDEVSNWTLSDQQRRIEIQVGVAYGSDTDQVSDLLLQVAKAHKDILEYPAPYVIFTDIGESALIFSLRGWVGRFGDFLRVRSELTGAVTKTLVEANIDVPFPQREIYLHSGDAAMKPESPREGGGDMVSGPPGEEE